VTDVPLDPTDLLTALSDAGVEFVLVGGFAVAAHGPIRPTGDLDVMVPKDDEANRKRIQRLLDDIGARLIERSGTEDYPTLMFQTRHGRLDLLYGPDGSDNYQRVKRRSVNRVVGGRNVAVAGRDDLIRMKLAAGRRQDLDDVAELTPPHEARIKIRLAFMLAEPVDFEWAQAVLFSRLEHLDANAVVGVEGGRLTGELETAALRPEQAVQWAQALADRLLGTGVTASSQPTVDVIERPARR
jgi:nucleotidyltransferase AbiEii toxin of type IV toxin-antitoxin system